MQIFKFLGFLVQFISYPVTAGFTSAAAISIGSTQIKSLLGIKGQANQFIESWETVFNNLDKIKKADATLGGCSIIVLLFLRVRVFNEKLFLATMINILANYIRLN